MGTCGAGAGVSFPAMTDSHTPPSPARIAFVGGGNMASAIIGGLLEQGTAADAVTVDSTHWERHRTIAEIVGLARERANT